MPRSLACQWCRECARARRLAKRQRRCPQCKSPPPPAPLSVPQVAVHFPCTDVASRHRGQLPHTCGPWFSCAIARACYVICRSMLRNLLSDYARLGRAQLELPIYDCECWAVGKPHMNAPQVIIPFCARVTVGIDANVAAFKVRRAIAAACGQPAQPGYPGTHRCRSHAPRHVCASFRRRRRQTCHGSMQSGTRRSRVRTAARRVTWPWPTRTLRRCVPVAHALPPPLLTR